MAEWFVRQSGAWVPLGGVDVDDPGNGNGGPDPEPPPPDWQAMVDQQSFGAVEAWYAANTGCRIPYNQLTPGSLTSTSHGQVIEGVRGGPIRIAHNNVTIRDCWVENWGTYGAHFNPTFSSSFSGGLLDHVTVAGPGGNPSQPRRGVLFMSGLSTTAVEVQHCDIYGWTSGATSHGGMLVEYSWIHNLASGQASGAHRTGLLTGGRATTYRRNYVTDGGSACISIYCDLSTMHNVSVEENILNGSSPNANPSYLINMKNGPQGPGAQNVHVRNNYLGPIFQFGLITGVNIPWGQSGNELSGNRHFLTGQQI